MGTTQVPADPQRVVVLDAMDNVLALGVRPVGAANWIGSATGELAGFPAHLEQSDLRGIEWLGNNASPNMERIVALDPDLILARFNRHEAIYDQLSVIAPTVVINQNAVGGWKGQLRAYGDALNRSAPAEQLLEEYEQRADQIGAELAALDYNPEVSVVRFDPGRIVIYGKEIFAGSVLEDAGVMRPAYQQKDQRSEEISLEQIDLIDADILITVAANPSESMLAEIGSSPLWQGLRAVEQEQVHAVSFDVWIGGWTIAGAHLILDDIDRYVLKADVEAAPGGDEFPVTIEHKFGATTIPARPEHVITVGYSEQDAVLALGVRPVAIRYWFGDEPYGVWPWSQDALGDAEPVLLEMTHGELNFELLASLDPDLLVATHSGITKEEYDALSAIAPTLAQPGEYADFAVPWQEQTRLIGKALGLSAKAEQLVAGVESQIVATREEYDGFDGASIAWATPAEGAGQFWVTGEDTPPIRFLKNLGMTFSPRIREIMGDEYSVLISNERLDLLDVDLLILRAASAEERAAIESNPILTRLDVYAEGRYIFFEVNDPVYGALSYSTVASLPYVIENLSPMIEDTLSP
jgi:iron complex transport system substrate-binding protein